jgi:hypothetical protein
VKLPGRRPWILFIFFLLLGGLIFTEVRLGKTIVSERSKIDDLRKREALLSRSIRENTRLVSVYKKALSQLEHYKLGVPEDEVDFYSNVEQQLTANGILVKSIQPTKAGPGQSAVRVQFEGLYYSILKVIADWRGLDVVVRMREISLDSDKAGFARGTVVLESVMGGEK